jgi:hypothetical protein
MNYKQEEKLIEIVVDFLIDSKNIHNADSFVIKAYGNKNNSKVPITFQFDDSPIDHVVIDYQQQKIIEECNGFNNYVDFIRLNCDLQRLKEIGYINYYLDYDLTDKLNEKLAPNNNE